MCRLPRVFVKTPHASQFYPDKMSTSIYINFTSQRRVRQHRIVSLQKRVYPAFKGFVYGKYLAMFNKQFNKHFCCTTWLVGSRCGHTMLRLNPLTYFWEYKTIVRGWSRGSS